MFYNVFLFFCTITTSAQDKQGNTIDSVTKFDNVLITVYIDGYNFDTNVLISNSNQIYLNVENLFETLKIKCLPKLNTLVGFIENKNNPYNINFEKEIITIGDKSINISKGIIEELGVKHIEVSLLFEAFGLEIIFNPRSLTAKLEANFELPFLKELRYKRARDNISKLQGEVTIVDTIIPRSYHLFKLGTLDWGLSSSQIISNTSSANMNIALGTELLFGQANFRMAYNTKNKFDIKNINYGWRWVNNDQKIIKQAYIGPISGPSSSSANAEIIGASISNSPTIVIKSKGSYTFTDTTEPNWTVELYINDVLIDYTQADAAGLYVFKVPIVYGYTVIKLKFYGPLGEERTEERIKNTPYNFIQEKKINYSLNTGIVQDSLNSRFASIALNYGLARNLTIAAGAEYLSSNFSKPFIPFTKVSYQPYSSMILNFEYKHQNTLKGLLNFNITKEAFLAMNYTQKITENINRASSAIENFEVEISTPLHIKSLNGFTRLKFQTRKYESFSYNQFNWTLSSYIQTLKINLSSLINWATANKAEMSSYLGLSYRLKNGAVLNSSTSYNINENKFNNLAINLQWRVLKLNLKASYQRTILTNSNSASLSVNYDLPFGRAGISSSYNGSGLNFSESATGSMAFSLDDSILHTANNSAIGKGGLLLHPFLDLNENGKLDKGEKKILLSSLQVQAAKAVISNKDSIVRVFDLNAFVNYTIKFSANSLDNIAWRFKHKTYKILVDPNQYKRVFIPVISVGEISGTVYLNSNSTIKGQSRVTLQILDEKENIVVETLSEFDGYYSYLGLKPGKYTVRIDPEQLKKLNYKALPKVHQVTIKVSEYGDIVDGLDFTLSKKAPKKPKE